MIQIQMQTQNIQIQIHIQNIQMIPLAGVERVQRQRVAPGTEGGVKRNTEAEYFENAMPAMKTEDLKTEFN